MSDQTSTPQSKALIVHGIDVTERTQCAHWHSDRDIIAIKHRCCGQYFACISCHNALTTTPTPTPTASADGQAPNGSQEGGIIPHKADVWRKDERDTPAVLCGNCKRELTVKEYLGCGNACPECQAAFNPGCARHYDLYFEM
ncbi:hypothetical protein BD289DRAFT_438354 [Coniella lustricola]|uniref:CHY-type domain-containing protein n=1 Tax=Coniella lustricola TaxID=2025994 RepID=A0A2T3A2Z0_9PEZI|nr:hypothetical protein BD289DRAFT_438354 [Coniella lustricola]